MKKQIYFLMIVLLLVMPMMMANSLGSVESIDWKTDKLLVTDVGVYDGKVLVKEIDKSEIWIDKKIGNVYHVDSLVNDVLIDIKLFYDIQPDTIDYRSHNGAYQNLYTYNDWTWEDKTDCKEEEYCGGYVILEVTLEQGQGSNTFASAISGATWMDDGVTITLVEDTDYTLSGSTFTIIDIEEAWRNITASWTYQTEGDVKQIINKTAKGLVSFTDFWEIIVLAIIITIVMSLIVMAFGREGRR